MSRWYSRFDYWNILKITSEPIAIRTQVFYLFPNSFVQKSLWKENCILHTPYWGLKVDFLLLVFVYLIWAVLLCRPQRSNKSWLQPSADLIGTLLDWLRGWDAFVGCRHTGHCRCDRDAAPRQPFTAGVDLHYGQIRTLRTSKIWLQPSGDLIRTLLNWLWRWDACTATVSEMPHFASSLLLEFERTC